MMNPNLFQNRLIRIEWELFTRVKWLDSVPTSDKILCEEGDFWDMTKM